MLVIYPSANYRADFCLTDLVVRALASLEPTHIDPSDSSMTEGMTYSLYTHLHRVRVTLTAGFAFGFE